MTLHSSIHLFIHWLIHSFLYPSFYLSIFIHISIYPFICLFDLSIYPSCHVEGKLQFRLGVGLAKLGLFELSMRHVRLAATPWGEVYMLYDDTDDDDEDDDGDTDDDLIMIIHTYMHALPSLNIIANISLSSFFTCMYTIRIFAIYSTLLHHTILYCAILYYTILYYTIIYCIILYYRFSSICSAGYAGTSSCAYIHACPRLSYRTVREPSWDHPAGWPRTTCPHDASQLSVPRGGFLSTAGSPTTPSSGLLGSTVTSHSLSYSTWLQLGW